MFQLLSYTNTTGQTQRKYSVLLNTTTFAISLLYIYCEINYVA